MLTRLRMSAVLALQNAALLSAGLLCCVAGLAFLTLSAWILLAQTHGALVAATVIGGLYTGVGFLLVAVALIRSQTRVHVHPAPAHGVRTSNPPLMQAFLTGFDTGTSTARRRP